MSTIPASHFVSVIPGVISAGGSALDLNGLLLTSGARIPIGSVLSFPSALAVTNYFGSGSAEDLAAAVYFNGFDGSTQKPGALLMAQYPAAAVGGFLRGGSLAGMTLAQLQLLTGTLILTVAGVVKTSATITLSGATSFSNAATLIQAAFTTPGFTVAYDSVSGAFVFSETATGATSTLTYATGTLATALKLTLATGAALSQGADVAVPAAFMAGIVATNQNWVTFATLFDPDVTGNTLKQAFAAWTNSAVDRYAYIAWDTDVTPGASTAATGSLGYLIDQATLSGTMPIFALTAAEGALKAAFILGFVASLDVEATNGRATAAYKSQAGLVADVTDETVAANLEANGYSYYGAVATANDRFVFMYPGSISGRFKWLDTFINQIWLNNGLQLALMTLLTQMKSIPYNAAGYAMIEQACADPINAALNFGAIRPGVQLSTLQATQVNTAAGKVVDGVLSTRGWYLLVHPASAIVRAARETPSCSFWYTDGQSIQRINLASIEIE